MKIVGTECPYCEKLQLATNEQIGLKVVCVHCIRTFICLDKTGELPFVKNGDSELPAIRFEKQITPAFFGYGIGIPPAMHDMVRSRLSKSLSMGEQVPVSLLIGNRQYSIGLKFFENHKGVICLHLLWTSESGIKKRLANEYPEAYQYYVTQKNATRYHPEWKVEVAVTTEEDVFILDEKRFATRHHTIPASKSKKPSKLRKSDREFLEGLVK